MKSKSFYALVDVDNFFVSCERVFNFKLRKKPVIVSSADGGCVLARSNEAKALGVPMGIPLFQIQELLQKNSIQVLSANFGLYADLSKRLMKSLEAFSPQIEIYSVDEAFLSFSELPDQEIKELGWQIKNTLYQWLGLPVSIGFAETKTLAKLATTQAKTQGVALLKKENLLSECGAWPVQEIWGIGRGFTRTLQSLSLYKISELMSLSSFEIHKILGSLGMRIWHELQGQACLSVEQIREPRKQIQVSRVFAKKLTELAPIQEAVCHYAAQAAQKAREENQAPGKIWVYLKDHEFHYQTSQMSLDTASSDTRDILEKAVLALKQIFVSGKKYRKAGVMLGEFLPENSIQMNWLTPRNFEKSEKLMQAVDRINQRFGGDQLRFLATGLNREWKRFSVTKSPNYTSSWNELLVVQA